MENLITKENEPGNFPIKLLVGVTLVLSLIGGLVLNEIYPNFVNGVAPDSQDIIILELGEKYKTSHDDYFVYTGYGVAVYDRFGDANNGGVGVYEIMIPASANLVWILGDKYTVLGKSVLKITLQRVG